MNLSALFIKRPVTTTLIMLGLLVFGVMAYRTLPVSDLPVIDFPTIQVSAGLPGASPETMASAVALPLEKQFSSISGVTSISSVSTQGNTNITLQFDLNRNIDAAAQDVQAQIARTTRALPANMPAPPSLQKQNPTEQPVMFLVLQSDNLPLSMVDEQAQSLAQRISMVSGVSPGGSRTSNTKTVRRRGSTGRSMPAVAASAPDQAPAASTTVPASSRSPVASRTARGCSSTTSSAR